MGEETWGPTPPQGTKKTVIDYVKSHPGTHIRRIAKELGLGLGDLRYHLHILEKEGLVRTRRSGLYKFVYPSNMFGDKQITILSLLSQETPSEILLFLIQKPGSTQKALVEQLRLTPATISWHMDRMVKEGVIERIKIGKFVEYHVTVSSDDVITFVQNYHPAIWEKWASRLADVLLLIGSKEEKIE